MAEVGTQSVSTHTVTVSRINGIALSYVHLQVLVYYYQQLLDPGTAALSIGVGLKGSDESDTVMPRTTFICFRVL
jgi:hypothetical protein